VPDGSVGCVRAFDFLEHVPTCRDSTCDHGADGMAGKCIVGLMNELYRVLAPGGWIISCTPSTDGRGGFQDSTHVSFWHPKRALVLHAARAGALRSRRALPLPGDARLASQSTGCWMCHCWCA